MKNKVRFSRPPLARMRDIHELMQRGQKTNCRTLALVLEVSEKTVQRDLDFMRDQLGLPIEYIVSTHSYIYARKVVQFPTMQISEGELIALSVAKKALTQYQRTPFEKPLRDACEKLTSGLRTQTQGAWGDAAGEAISFRASGQSIGDPSLFEAASESVLQREEIEFSYRKLGGSKEAARIVQPLHLACIEQQWYIFGLDLQRAGQVRTFALTRMSRLQRTGRHFECAKRFSLDEHLASSFGVFSAGKVERIVLQFDELGGELVRDRTWHGTQTIEPLPGAGLRLTLEVGVSSELEQWILGWGERVEVLTPASLRAAIATKAQRVAAIYRTQA